MKLKLYLFLLAFSCQFISFGQTYFPGSDGFTYTINPGNTTVTLFSGYGCGSNNLVLSDVVFDETTDPTNPTPYIVTGIGPYAFANCPNITTVSLPTSIYSIGDGAFKDCSSLISVINFNYVSVIGASAFEGCSSFSSIIIPSNVHTIKNGTFKGCSSLTTITIPFAAQNIESSAFENCTALQSVIFENSNYISSIGFSVFAGCTSLSSITFPDTLSNFGDYVFKNCTSLTSITIPSSITNIGHESFYGSGLTSITIPSSVTNMQINAFSNCANLTSVTIPSTMTGIGAGSFFNCPNLTSVTCGIVNPLVIDASVFGGTTNQGTCILNVPSASLSTYQTTAVWEDFAFLSPATHLNFDGVDDRVDLSLPVVFNNTTTNAFSVEFLIKPSVFNFSRIFFAQKDVNNFFTISLGDDGSIYAYLNNTTSSQTSSSLNISNWTHIAVSKEATTNQILIYFDGVLQNTINGGGSSTGTNDLLTLGSRTNQEQFYNGNLDEVRIWNRVLSVAEIQNNMNCELPSPSTQNGLVAYYQFNQGNDGADNSTITTLTDATANANNGTLTNFALTGTTSNFLAGSSIVTGTNCTVLSTSSFDISENINVYPNPTNGNVNVMINNLTNVSVSVYDLNGRQILNKDLSANENTVDISNFQTGMYLFRIKSSEGEIVKKVIKN